MKTKTKIIIAISSLLFIGIALTMLLTSCDTKKDEEIINDNHLSYKLNALTDVDYEAEDMAGYKLATSFVFTNNIDTKKAIEALKPYMIFYDGEPVHTDSSIVVNINGNRADIACTFPDKTTKHINSGVTFIDSPDGVEFAACTPFEFFRYACVIDKSTCPSGYDVNKVATYANTCWYHNLEDPQYDLNYNDSLQEENEIWDDCTFRTGNGKYHIAYANVRILNNLTKDGFVGTVNNTDTYQEPSAPITNTDTESPSNTNTPTEDNNQNIGDTIGDKIEEIKNNNKEAFDIATIIISSVLGIALLYNLFLIVRKIWRSLKR